MLKRKSVKKAKNTGKTGMASKSGRPNKTGMAGKSGRPSKTGIVSKEGRVGKPGIISRTKKVMTPGNAGKIGIAGAIGAAAVFSVAGFRKFKKGLSVKHVNSTSLFENDFSEQAQIYFEYIGKNLKNRLIGMPDHEKTQAFIIRELKWAGYTNEQICIQKIEGRSGKNIVVKVEGTDVRKSMVVGAHYDGDGVGDNGSGVALLLAEVCGLKQKILPVTTYFVFFDEEEDGEFGSSYFAASLSAEEIESVIYMINMDALAFGDYCNIYGGWQNPETKEISQLEGYEYACEVAKQLGFNVYGTSELDGYFAEHGEGPALDPTGIFTSPWTKANPAPEDTVRDSLHAYSPTTIPASDHVPFMERGIPYIYFEATNWFAKSNDDSIAYVGYADVRDRAVGEGGMIMNTVYDTLDTMNLYYPGRSLEHFKLYSPILSELILKPNC